MAFLSLSRPTPTAAKPQLFRSPHEMIETLIAQQAESDEGLV